MAAMAWDGCFGICGISGCLEGTCVEFGGMALYYDVSGSSCGDCAGG